MVDCEKLVPNRCGNPKLAVVPSPIHSMSDGPTILRPLTLTIMLAGFVPVGTSDNVTNPLALIAASTTNVCVTGVLQDL